VILIGLGNAFRRDDGIGTEILKRLPEVPGQYCEGDPLRLMAALDGESRALIVDAVEGSQPGRIHRWDWKHVPQEFLRPRLSSHGMSLLEALALMEQSNRLPESVVIYGVVGQDFGWGEGFSPEVASAMDGLEEAVREEFFDAAKTAGPT
jgi:hydrogenase maturation protease